MIVRLLTTLGVAATALIAVQDTPQPQSHDLTVR
jgi:hypothetical protein